MLSHPECGGGGGAEGDEEDNGSAETGVSDGLCNTTVRFSPSLDSVDSDDRHVPRHQKAVNYRERSPFVLRGFFESPAAL